MHTKLNNSSHYMKKFIRAVVAIKSIHNSKYTRNRFTKIPLALLVTPILLVPASPTAAETNASVELARQLPDLLNMIQERQQHLKDSLNKDNTNYQTYGENSDLIPSFSTSQKPQNSQNPSTPPQNSYLTNVDPEAAFENGLRDPFSVTKKIIDLNEPDEESAANNPFVSTTTDNIPKLKLRGVIMHNQDSSPLALLDIAGNGVHMVRVGDRIGFNATNPLQVLKIKQINRLNVIVEIGTLGDLVVVR